MVFSSAVFLFLFLPAVLASHFLFPRRLRNLHLFAASLFFYAWGEPDVVLVLFGSIAFNYVVGRRIAALHATLASRLWLGFGIAANLVVLGFLKYANFLVDNTNVALGGLGLAPIELAPIALPIGISFYTFQSISYLVDVSRGSAPAQRNLVDFGLYVALFPQLIAGPIVRYKQIARQIEERRARLSESALGVARFSIGLAKKMLIANPAAELADAIFALEANELTAAVAALGALAYSLQIYFDFSGYSDMAIGLGRFFGFRIPENFDFPYVARSITDFWRRWHISLSTWFRDYLYIPMGGNRGGSLRTGRNLVTVFVLCGLWHGAAWTFLVWGLYHGLFLVLERAGLLALLERLPRLARHAYAIAVVLVGWVIFRAETLPHGIAYLGALVGLGEGSGVAHHVALFLTSDRALAITAGCVFSLPWVPALRERWLRGSPQPYGSGWPGVFAHAATAIFAIAMLALSMLQLAGGTTNPFLYFRF